MATDDPPIVRDLCEDQSLHRKDAQVRPFHQGRDVDSDVARVCSTLLSLKRPPQGRPVSAPVTVIDYIAKLELFFDAMPFASMQ